MPPARPRVLEDTRSETSNTNIKDRVASSTANSKPKKAAANAAVAALSSSKTTLNSASFAPAAVNSIGAANAEHETPHVRCPNLVSL